MLLETLAAQADLLQQALEQLSEEAFIETAGGRRGRLMLPLEQRAADLGGRAVSDPVESDHLAETGESGTATVGFGDGVRGRRPAAGAGRLTVAYEHGSGSISVQVGPDGVIFEGGPAGSPSIQAGGIYRGVVVDAVDPLLRGRLLVQIPNLLAERSAWAMPCFTPSAASTPAVGDGVWILFEAGDLESPVWLGAIS